MSDMNFRVDTTDEELNMGAVLKVPIFITETGIADKKDSYRRDFIEGHFPVILRAIKDGYDVRGVYFWTLMDNIEWHEGFHVKFGLCEWDPILQRANWHEGFHVVKFGLCEWDPILQRANGLRLRPGSRALGEGLRLRPGSRALGEVYRSWPVSLHAIRLFSEDPEAGREEVEVEEKAPNTAESANTPTHWRTNLVAARSEGDIAVDFGLSEPAKGDIAVDFGLSETSKGT
eukprot:gene12374-15560_t